MFLVDSTLYIDLLRAKYDPVEVLQPWLLHDEILCCGVIRCEVLRGIVNKRVYERMCELFDALSPIDIDTAMWEATARLAWTLDRRGKVLPLTDLLIAGCALRVKATVISSDEYFKEIPGLAIEASLPKR